MTLSPSPPPPCHELCRQLDFFSVRLSLRPPSFTTQLSYLLSYRSLPANCLQYPVYRFPPPLHLLSPPYSGTPPVRPLMWACGNAPTKHSLRPPPQLPSLASFLAHSTSACDNRRPSSHIRHPRATESTCREPYHSFAVLSCCGPHLRSTKSFVLQEGHMSVATEDGRECVACMSRLPCVSPAVFHSVISLAIQSDSFLLVMPTHVCASLSDTPKLYHHASIIQL